VLLPMPEAPAYSQVEPLKAAIPSLTDNFSVPEIIVDETDRERFTETLLIVEDNDELRYFIAAHFKRMFNVHTASNGREGLEHALEHMPSLIISDVMMPEMDGVEMTTLIKQDERTSHIPVILLTAKVGQEEKIAALRLGTEEYLSKPFSISELEIRVHNVIESRKKLAEYFKKLFESDQHENQADVETTAIVSINARFIEKIRACINENISDPAFSVEKLAGEMCLSRTQLFRKVKLVLDTSPSDLISDMRLQKAARLIESKADTLAQIAYAVGFTEQSYFAKRFRKKYGVSPRDYADRV
jgi:YesN/AraC family two-component response regulator